MAKLIINEENKRVVLSRKSMDIFGASGEMYL